VRCGEVDAPARRRPTAPGHELDAAARASHRAASHEQKVAALVGREIHSHALTTENHHIAAVAAVRKTGVASEAADDGHHTALLHRILSLAGGEENVAAVRAHACFVVRSTVDVISELGCDANRQRNVSARPELSISSAHRNMSRVTSECAARAHKDIAADCIRQCVGARMLRTDHYIAARCQIAAPAAKLDAPTESRSSVAAGDEHIAARVIDIVAAERETSIEDQAPTVAAVTRVIALTHASCDRYGPASVLRIDCPPGIYADLSTIALAAVHGPLFS